MVISILSYQSHNSKVFNWYISSLARVKSGSWVSESLHWLTQIISRASCDAKNLPMLPQVLDFEQERENCAASISAGQPKLWLKRAAMWWLPGYREATLQYNAVYRLYRHKNASAFQWILMHFNLLALKKNTSEKKCCFDAMIWRQYNGWVHHQRQPLIIREPLLAPL